MILFFISFFLFIYLCLFVVFFFLYTCALSCFIRSPKPELIDNRQVVQTDEIPFRLLQISLLRYITEELTVSIR